MEAKKTKEINLIPANLLILYSGLNEKKSGQNHSFKKKEDKSFKSSPTSTILNFLN